MNTSEAGGRFHRFVDIATNIAMMLACVAVLALTGFQIYDRRPVATPQSKNVSLKAGDKLDALDGVNFDAADRTLVLFLASDCRYCKDEIPFYQRLSLMMSSATPGTAQLVMATSDPPDEARSYAATNELRLTQIVTLSPEQRARLRVPGTPTLILVNKSAMVEHVWFGRLDQAREDEVIVRLVPRT